MNDGGLAVVEPIRTRNIQIVACISIVTSLVIFRCIPSTDTWTPTSIVAVPVALLTAPYHLTIIFLAFKQRRKLYTPDEIPKLVPVTARAGVVVSSWVLCCLWLVVAMFYLMDLGAPRHKTLFVLTTAEAGLLFAACIMCSRERLELLERLAQEPTSLMFLVDEHGEQVVMEGP